MAYELFYWALRGRGEQVRLLLNELEQDYEDVHVVKDADFQRMQREGPGSCTSISSSDRTLPNKALHLTANSLRSIAACELDR